MSKNKETKRVYISTEILTISREDPAGAMAHFLMAAFGVTLEECVSAVLKMVVTKDIKVGLMCMNAAVQIRGHVTFIPNIISPTVPEYKVFIITGTREKTPDQFNFGALHICGHILATWMLGVPETPGKLAARMLKKAGSCVDFNYSQYPESDAGVINKEIAMEWTPDSVKMMKDSYNTLAEAGKNVVVDWFKNAQKYAEAFDEKVNPKTATASSVGASQASAKQ